MNPPRRRSDRLLLVAVVLLLLTFTMLFVAGAKLGYILGASIVGAAISVHVVAGPGKKRCADHLVEPPLSSEQRAHRGAASARAK